MIEDNNIRIDLTPEERNQVEEILNPLIQHFPIKHSIEDKLYFWREGIYWMKDPEYMHFMDYTNQLGGRKIIQKVINASSIEIQEKIIEILSPLDEEFRQVTMKTDTPVIEGYSDDWWLWRIPKKASEEFKNFRLSDFKRIKAEELKDILAKRKVLGRS